MEVNQLYAGRYRLIKELGRGSFGEVWLAHDEQLDNMRVAVKVYIALDDRGIEDFKKEYKTAYGLNHPNLLHAYHFDVCDKRPYLVMPYCPDSALSLIGHCDTETLWQLIKDVSSGLAYLHSLDIVHHDIKPDNILRKEDGTFVITDFGISTKMRSTLRRNSTRAMSQNDSAGSLPYMGPEMFSDTPQSIKATDIWAFGATLYEIITGDLPFFGQGGVMQLNGAPVPKLTYEDPIITNIVKACMAPETWDRPTAEDLSGGHIRRSGKERDRKTTKYWIRISILAFVLGILVFGGFGLYVQKKSIPGKDGKSVPVIDNRKNENADDYHNSLFDDYSKGLILNHFTYRIIREGDSERALDNDGVYCTYFVLLSDGSLIDDETTSAIRLTPKNLIAGFREGLKLIGNEGEIELLIPPDLAYGEQGCNGVPPNSTLFIKVNIMKIIHVH